MAGKFTHQINLMIKGLIHVYNDIYTLDTRQIYLHNQKRNITQFKLYHQEVNPITGANQKVVVLETFTQIDIVKYLADRLNELREDKENGT